MYIVMNLSTLKFWHASAAEARFWQTGRLFAHYNVYREGYPYPITPQEIT